MVHVAFVHNVNAGEQGKDRAHSLKLTQDDSRSIQNHFLLKLTVIPGIQQRKNLYIAMCSIVGKKRDAWNIQVNLPM